jgi:predicted TIM-barrel fold metal-dependent hydrolase
MLIPVIYFDNHPGKVKAEKLDEFIRRRLIMAFRRSNGWVKVSGCRYRGAGGNYKGPNRRKNKDC